MSDPVPYLDGHCATAGKPDQYHALCRGGYRSVFGVDHVCVCIRHQEDEEANAAE